MLFNRCRRSRRRTSSGRARRAFFPSQQRLDRLSGRHDRRRNRCVTACCCWRAPAFVAGCSRRHAELPRPRGRRRREATSWVVATLAGAAAGTDARSDGRAGAARRHRPGRGRGADPGLLFGGRCARSATVRRTRRASSASSSWRCRRRPSRAVGPARTRQLSAAVFVPNLALKQMRGGAAVRRRGGADAGPAGRARATATHVRPLTPDEIITSLSVC